MAINIAKQKLISLYKKNKQIEYLCSDFITTYPLIKIYNNGDKLKSYFSELNRIIELIRPTVSEVISPDSHSIDIIFKLFSTTNYCTAIIQCPWGPLLSSLVISVYSPRYYFYALPENEINILLEKLNLITYVNLDYPVKQILLIDIYDAMYEKYAVSPFYLCNLLLL